MECFDSLQNIELLKKKVCQSASEPEAESSPKVSTVGDTVPHPS